MNLESVIEANKSETLRIIPCLTPGAEPFRTCQWSSTCLFHDEDTKLLSKRIGSFISNNSNFITAAYPIEVVVAFYHRRLDRTKRHPLTAVTLQNETKRMMHGKPGSGTTRMYGRPPIRMKYIYCMCDEESETCTCDGDSEYDSMSEMGGVTDDTDSGYN